jgi:hypothetical protein
MNFTYPMNQTTEEVEALIQEGQSNPLNDLVLELKISNALRRQQIKATKDQNKLTALLISIQEEGFEINPGGAPYHTRIAKELIADNQ